MNYQNLYLKKVKAKLEEKKRKKLNPNPYTNPTKRRKKPYPNSNTNPRKSRPPTKKRKKHKK